MAQCPHCQSVLPEPAGSFCPQCGSPLSASAEVPPPPPPPSPPPSFVSESLPESALPPPQAPPPPAAEASAGTPWDGRARLGIAPALAETTRQVLLSPVAFFRAMPTTGGLGGPLGYALILGYIGILATAIYQGLFGALTGSALRALEGRGDIPALAMLQGGFGFLVQVVFGPVVLLVGIFLASGIVHLMLALMGAAHRGFEATFRVVCYSEATSVLMILPFCGGLLAFVWWLVVTILGLAEAHGISRALAAIAVLAPIVILCCCCGGLAMMFGGLASLAGLRG
jgi:hypothetical protein